MGGNLVSSCIECWIISDLAGCRGYEANSLVPLTMQQPCCLDITTWRAAAAVAARSDVFEAGGVLNEGSNVGLVPACGGRADQDAPEDS